MPRPAGNTKFTLSVDDFDSLITYPDQSQWTTPDPSAAHDPANDIWFDDTYHRTNVTGASFSFGFKGSVFSLYGAAGPAFGSYEVDVDGRTEIRSAHAAKNASGHLLFSTKSLPYTDHTVKVTNLGAKHYGEGTDLLVDLLTTTVDIAPAGATLTNTTLQETDDRLSYTGNWTENVFNPLFSGGFSRFTNGDAASVSLNFTATAIFIFGDKTDRHGLYTVTLDNHPPQTFNGESANASASVSGCGGAFAHACEKDNTLAFFAANLDDKQHTVTVTNIPGALGAFFDLDAIVLTTPSTYLREHASGRSLPPSLPRLADPAIARRTSGAERTFGAPSAGMNLLLLLWVLCGVMFAHARPVRR
ncbi:hypothetical protein MVEN_01983400 [Mycena venus]|uniref:Uncharacterized protein n=1 Tax=Mycena venus TaxID=2733690 RepID=A0A8H7CIU1_9AGAR|nr:hypothetical protein MVEN_01983400 [Mycena venus]